jgi:hypothetical protein
MQRYVCHSASKIRLLRPWRPFNVYEAKKAAEVAPGVGKLTDLAIIKGGKVSFAETLLFEVLEKVHKEKPSLTDAENDELKKACDDCAGA